MWQHLPHLKPDQGGPTIINRFKIQLPDGTPAVRDTETAEVGTTVTVVLNETTINDLTFRMISSDGQMRANEGNMPQALQDTNTLGTVSYILGPFQESQEAFSSSRPSVDESTDGNYSDIGSVSSIETTATSQISSFKLPPPNSPKYEN